MVAIREKTLKQHPYDVVTACLKQPPETLSSAVYCGVFSCYSKAKPGVASCCFVGQK